MFGCCDSENHLAKHVAVVFLLERSERLERTAGGSREDDKVIGCETNAPDSAKANIFDACADYRVVAVTKGSMRQLDSHHLRRDELTFRI